MSLEKSVNEYGQEQIIHNADKIIKIGNSFLQVRLIQTKKWKEMHRANGRFTQPMPRARFVRPEANPYYLVRRDDLIKLQEENK